ncbi:hypothetical protein AAFF_G00339390 [Aldrovandia affinis]|uniref:Uncharacterized protein n=1 Tax=Aldrovandia affinis TaxID=143900 RepID=A0AAD7SME6_9TELE|nr:hypothetical protein AAFF_G00339390 [Aldrovandia affinis]
MGTSQIKETTAPLCSQLQVTRKPGPATFRQGNPFSVPYEPAPAKATPHEHHKQMGTSQIKETTAPLCSQLQVTRK